MGTLGIVPQGDSSVDLHGPSILCANSLICWQFQKSRTKETPPPPLFLLVFNVYINMETNRTAEVLKRWCCLVAQWQSSVAKVLYLPASTTKRDKQTEKINEKAWRLFPLLSGAMATSRSIRERLLDEKWTKILEGEIQMNNRLKNLKSMPT